MNGNVELKLRIQKEGLLGILGLKYTNVHFFLAPIEGNKYPIMTSVDLDKKKLK